MPAALVRYGQDLLYFQFIVLQAINCLDIIDAYPEFLGNFGKTVSLAYRLLLVRSRRSGKPEGNKAND